MSLKFQVSCQETRPGEAVFVTGGLGALGDWSPKMALPLLTTSSTFPLWSSDPIQVPPGTEVSYKYIIMKEDRAGQPRWEDGELKGNREVTSERKTLLTVKSTWGKKAVETSSAPSSSDDAQTMMIKKTSSMKSYKEKTEERQGEEQRLIKMAEAAVSDAKEESVENPLVKEHAAREQMKRNFSQSLINLAVDPVVEQAGKETGGDQPNRMGVSLKHINSFSALSTLAEPSEKAALRESECKATSMYKAHNTDVPVVVVTSEFAPWSKTGGLGLVASSYSYEFPKRGHRTMVVSPKYKHYPNLNYIGETKVVVNGREEVVKFMHHFMEVEDGRGCDCVFVEHPSISKDGGLYNDNDGREYPDNLFRFTLLSLAAMEAPLILKLGGSTYGDKVLFLANDWQAGLVPVYMCYKYRPHGTYAQARVIYVVHNLGYQGMYHGHDPCHLFGVSQAAKNDLAFGDCLNLSKAALICADRVVTVSPNYAKEIQTPEGGFCLQDFVRAKAQALRLSGILNGIDDVWNPQTDKHLDYNFSVVDFQEKKALSKKALQRSLGLHEDPDCVLIGFVGRLTWQKGVDVIGSIIPWLMEDAGNGVTGRVQLIMMGNGEKKYAETLQWAENAYRGRVCGYCGFDPKVEHKVMGGCDLFLMPSRYEPCGLPQMYSQQYGTLPIVTKTGGLADTVRDLSEGIDVATGFHIWPLESGTMKEVVYRACELYLKHNDEFVNMQRTAMQTNFYWPKAMDDYEKQIDHTLYDPPTVR
eukprot:TRINITY_DN1671_c0_g1_i1.p1 TRINITY_DN1671_c0_g1~~TRINITY_DN1671_c0_g1_i1.p1  ORF type:complete len:755 (-),score=120.71 TRINITY_DN1671_c0_g1_i1:268-2532(-)